MKAGDPVAVHPHPGPDQEHGGSRGSDDIGKQHGDQQKENIPQWGGFSFHPDMDSSGHNEEGGHQNDEPRVFMQRIEQSRIPVNRKEIICDNDTSEQQGNLG